MKRLTGRIAAVLLTLILLLTSISVPAYAAQKEQKPRAIAIVFDNSYSMYLINEAAAGKREEIITKLRNDEYGKGFLKYLEHYPLSTGAAQAQATPFDDPAKPL